MVQQGSWWRRNAWLFVAVASLPMIKACISGVLLHDLRLALIAGALSLADLALAAWLFLRAQTAG